MVHRIEAHQKEGEVTAPRAESGSLTALEQDAGWTRLVWGVLAFALLVVILAASGG